jgi:hypothetical protein
MFDNRDIELYLDIIPDHSVSAMPKRYIYIIVFDGLFTDGRACLEFTHSWRDYRILLFYSNRTCLHKVNQLGLRIVFNTDNRKNLRSGRFLQRTERSVLSLIIIIIIRIIY